MNKGVIYVMTTAVPGLIKIGRTQTKQYNTRMSFLEKNGYYNTVGLKRAFAIELNDYAEKEKLVHEVFSKHRVGDSELFALDFELVEQLLLAFDGKVIYPKDVDKEQRFDAVTASRTRDNLFNFYRKGLKNGDQITFFYDPTITATVIGEREVEYNGYPYKLSRISRELMEQMDRGNTSGAYQGSRYWCFNGVKLSQLKDR